MFTAAPGEAVLKKNIAKPGQASNEVASRHWRRRRRRQPLLLLFFN